MTDALDRAIAPYRLPAGVRDIWALPPETFAFPEPCGAELALTIWRQHLDLPGLVPPLLFPVCYASHAHVLVELDDANRPGGAMFQWYVDGTDPFIQVAPSPAAYVALATTGTDVLPVDDDAPVVDGSPLRWPRHWLESVGPAALDREPRGATAVLADLVDGRRSDGRVQGVVRRILGSAEGSLATVDDGTARLDVWCPTPVTVYGPIQGRRFEIDVVVRDGRAEAAALRPVEEAG